MTVQLAADYLTPPAPPSAFKSAGYSAVLRYLKNLSATEVEAILAAGLGLATLFETLANEALGGAAAGTADAASAVAMAEALRQPKGTALGYAVADFQPTAAQLTALFQYDRAFRGALSAAGYVPMPYVTRFALDGLIARGASATAELWWENPMTDAGVTGTVVDSNAALYQRLWPTVSVNGIAPSARAWDENVVLKPIPWWTASAPAPPPPPPPAPTPLAAPIVAMLETPSGQGYYLIGADGGVLTYGDAVFHGSMGNKPLAKPICGAALTASGNGYWLVGQDGGIFCFGDAEFYGSMGGKTLAKPICSMARTPDGAGYILVGQDGGIFTFGDATFHGTPA